MGSDYCTWNNHGVCFSPTCVPDGAFWRGPSSGLVQGFFFLSLNFAIAMRGGAFVKIQYGQYQFNLQRDPSCLDPCPTLKLSLLYPDWQSTRKGSFHWPDAAIASDMTFLRVQSFVLDALKTQNRLNFSGFWTIFESFLLLSYSFENPRRRSSNIVLLFMHPFWEKVLLLLYPRKINGWSCKQ